MRSGPNSDCQERSRKRRKYTISRRARSFSAVANRTLDSRKKHPLSLFFAVFAAPRRRDLGTSFPHVAILALKSSDLFVVYLSTLSTCSRRRDDDDGESPSWTQFGRYSFFFLFFAIILRSPRARSIDVYDAKAQSASFFCLLESLHDYGLLKLFDREGTEFSRPTTETFSWFTTLVQAHSRGFAGFANARIFPPPLRSFSNFSDEISQ